MKIKEITNVDCFNDMYNLLCVKCTEKMPFIPADHLCLNFDVSKYIVDSVQNDIFISRKCSIGKRSFWIVEDLYLEKSFFSRSKLAVEDSEIIAFLRAIKANKFFKEKQKEQEDYNNSVE